MTSFKVVKDNGLLISVLFHGHIDGIFLGITTEELTDALIKSFFKRNVLKSAMDSTPSWTTKQSLASRCAQISSTPRHACPILRINCFNNLATSDTACFGKIIHKKLSISLANGCALLNCVLLWNSNTNSIKVCKINWKRSMRTHDARLLRDWPMHPLVIEEKTRHIRHRTNQLNSEMSILERESNLMTSHKKEKTRHFFGILWLSKRGTLQTVNNAPRIARQNTPKMSRTQIRKNKIELQNAIRTSSTFATERRPQTEV